MMVVMLLVMRIIAYVGRAEVEVVVADGGPVFRGDYAVGGRLEVYGYAADYCSGVAVPTPGCEPFRSAGREFLRSTAVSSEASINAQARESGWTRAQWIW